MKRASRLRLAVALALFACGLEGLFHPGTPQETAFEGAQGFGVTTPAGRGGAVKKVITLRDGHDVPGSLRMALNAPGPRIIEFAVAGEIHLVDKLEIKEPYISILGQTAPGAGITLRNYPIVVSTHDVLIQHVRVRIGDQQPKFSDTLDGIRIQSAVRTDSVTLENTGTYNVVIDHCSISWGIDENLDIGRARDVTISNCIISEALASPLHPKGAHSMGILVSHSVRLAFLNNLIAHCRERVPKIGGYTQSVVCNNVIYNPVWSFAEIHNLWDRPVLPKASFIGNVAIPGPDTKPGARKGDQARYALVLHHMGPGAEIYVADNLCARFDGDPWSCVQIDKTAENANPRVVEPPVMCEPLTIRPQEDVLEWVLQNAGAQPRDSIDARIVNDVLNRTGTYIVSPGKPHPPED